MIINKIGLSEGKTDIDPEVDAFNFKPYEYTDIDALQTYEKTEVCNIIIDKPFKIRNSVMYIGNESYDIGDKTLQDIYNIVSLYGSINFFTGYESFRNLPAILLNDCNNTILTVIDGDISPTDVSQLNKNRTMVAIVESVPKITVYDYENNIEKNYTKVGNKIFFNPSTSTKIYIQKTSTNFNLTIDMSPRRIANANVVSTLLNYGEVM